MAPPAPAAPTVGSLVDPEAWPMISLLVDEEALAASAGSRGDYKLLYQEIGNFILAARDADNTSKANANALNKENTALTASLATSESALVAANSQFMTLQNTFARSFQSLASTPAAITVDPFKTVNFDTFNNFKGEEDKADLGIFLYNIHAKFLHNSNQFQSEQAKMAWYTTRLEGDARRQIQHALKDDGRVDFADCAAITTILKMAYVKPDAARIATAELRKWEQKNKPFSEFISHFQSLYPTCDRDDTTIIEILEHNMASELYQRLVNLKDPLPVTVSAYIALCRIEDVNLRKIKDQSRDQKTGYFGSHGGNGQKPSNAPAPPADDPMDISKMDLSHVQNGKLTEEEKLRRKANNLCMYDGENHPTVSCPKLKIKEKKETENLLANASKEVLLAALAAKN